MKRNGKYVNYGASLAGHPHLDRGFKAREVDAACRVWLTKRDPNYRPGLVPRGITFGRKAQ